MGDGRWVGPESGLPGGEVGGRPRDSGVDMRREVEWR